MDLLMRETRPKKVFRKSWKKVSIAFFFTRRAATAVPSASGERRDVRRRGEASPPRAPAERRPTRDAFSAFA